MPSGHVVPEADAAEPPSLDHLIAGDAQLLSRQLTALRQRLFPPAAQKTLRRFTRAEAAALLDLDEAALHQILPATTRAGRGTYALAEIHALRRRLAPPGESHLPERQGGEHLQTLAVTNFKGGSGKTTTAAHLAQYLALHAYRVLAIDLDPQASLSALFGCQPETDIGEGETFYGALRYDGQARPLEKIVRPTYFAGLDLVPGNLELQEFEHETPRMLARGRGTAEDLFFARVAEALATVADRYDVVVIDCPPQLGFLTLAALCAASAVLVTVHPQMLDVASMSQFLLMTADLLDVVRRAGGRLRLDFLRYLITRYEPQDLPQAQVVGFLRGLFGARVLDHAMLKSTAIADAGLTRQTLYEIGRQGMTRATYGRALASLNAVNGEIERLIRAAWGRAP